jgi:membrane protein DedA with SNARE-associated domain
LLIGLFVGGVSVLPFAVMPFGFSLDIQSMGALGYFGVFAITLLGHAGLFAPVPYLPAILAAGVVLNPGMVALSAGTAAALGEMTGYVCGVSGRDTLPSWQWIQRIERAFVRYGYSGIFLASLIPNPFGKAVGLAAGASRRPAWAYFVLCFLGKSARFWALAALGAALWPK